MRICLTTFYSTSYSSLAEITVTEMDKYCKRHGYHLDVKVIDDSESFHFVKTERARQLLDAFDLIVAIEADVLITNHTIPVTNFIDNYNELFYTTDRNGANFGVFIVKSTKWGKELLEWIQVHKGKLGDEQNVVEANPDIEKVSVVKHPCFNSIPYSPHYAPSYGKIGYKDGDEVDEPTETQGAWVKGQSFTAHLPGMSLAARLNIFNEMKQHIVYE